MCFGSLTGYILKNSQFQTVSFKIGSERELTFSNACTNPSVVRHVDASWNQLKQIYVTSRILTRFCEFLTFMTLFIRKTMRFAHK